MLTWRSVGTPLGRFARSAFVLCFQLGSRSVQDLSFPMPRQLRIEFEGAVYHVMARGNAQQKIVRDDADRRRMIGGLETTVARNDW